MEACLLSPTAWLSHSFTNAISRSWGLLKAIPFLSPRSVQAYRIALLLALLLALPATAQAMPRTEKELRIITDKLIETSVSYGAIPSLYRPRFIRVVDASLSMDHNEQVFVVKMPDGIRIYPQRIMVWHQIVNELIDDVAYCVTYSPITGTMAAYLANIRGMNLIFDTEGRLFSGNSVMIDRNSGSLWLQALGMAFDGPLIGRGMELLPSVWTSWKQAKQAYPDAMVLATPPEGARPYGRDPYGSYQTSDNYYDNDILVYPLTRIDKRLHRKSSVIGLEIDNKMLGVEIAYVKKKGVVNFFLEERPLLAVYDEKIGAARILDRQVWDKALLFTMRDGQLIDIQTESVWSPDGKALSGKLKGASLQEFFGIYSMWFLWGDIHPESYVIPGPGIVPDEALILSKPLEGEWKDK